MHIGWRRRRGSSPAARTGARQRAGLTPASASNTLQVAIIVNRQCDGFVDCSELAREVRDRRIGQGLSLRVDNAAVLAILPFRQARDDARSDRLQLTQPTVGLRGWCPRRGLEQFTIL